MQIGSALRAGPFEPNAAITQGSTVENAPTAQGHSQGSPSTQDDAITLSAEGTAAVAQETGADSTAEGDPAVDVSAVKSFAYGTLGLERPDQVPETHNPFYTAGRWLAAGITVGGIVSLLV
jgi:hypothetical protein